MRAAFQLATVAVNLLAIGATAFAADTRLVASGPGVTLLGGPSPDGKWVSMVRDGNLIAVPASGGEPRVLARAANGEFAYFSAFARDSHQIAYAWFNGQRFYELRVTDLDGTTPRTVYRNPEAGFVQPCAWFGDGRYILTLLFRRDNTSQIALIPSAGGAPRILKSLNWVYPKRMDLTPDGRFIVYDTLASEGTSRRALYLLATDGSREERISGDADAAFPVFLDSGGKQIAYLKNTSIVALDLATRQERVIVADAAHAVVLGVANGDVFYGRRTSVSDVFVALLDDPVGTARRVTMKFAGLNSAPAFSQDGKWLAYLSRRGAENFGEPARAIVVRSLSGDLEREVPARLAHVESVSWTPDGALLASGSDNKGRAGVYRVDVATAAVTPVADDADAPFRGYRAAALVDGTVCWISNEARCGEKPFGPARLLAAAGDQLALADERQVRVFRGGKLEASHLLANVTELAIHPSCLIAAWGDGVYSLDAGRPRALRMPGNRLPGLSLHPDGRQIALVAGQSTSEIWRANAVRESPPTLLGLDEIVPAAPTNPITRAKAELGKRLFFEKRLSRDGTIACASCHDPAHAFADLRPQAIGIDGQNAGRRSPRIANRAWGRSFFWDGRAPTLEEQVLQPIANPKEMALDPSAAAQRVGLSLTDMRDALATYVRTIIAGNSPYDRYVAGDASALTPRQVDGLRLFRGKGRCASCHVGPILADEQLHESGIGGRRIKTPSLRDAARTPPYMHNGSLAALHDVIDFYDRGGHTKLTLQLTTAEKEALLDFLTALNGEIRDGF